MYLISRSSGLTLPLRGGKTEYASNGAVIKVHPALSVQFQHSPGTPDWAKDAVQKLPSWGNGVGDNDDPFRRVGILDTDEEAKRQNWDADEKAFVEEALRNATSNGIEYVIAAAPRAGKPWDSYDEFSGEDAAEKILYTINLIGGDPRAVLRYEKENADRDEVVAALQGLIEQEEEDVVGVISV